MGFSDLFAHNVMVGWHGPLEMKITFDKECKQWSYNVLCNDCAMHPSNIELHNAYGGVR